MKSCKTEDVIGMKRVPCLHESCPIESSGGSCPSCFRFVCLPETPWIEDKGRSLHPYASEVPDSQFGNWPSGDTVRMKCPICTASWIMELPQ